MDTMDDEEQMFHPSYKFSAPAVGFAPPTLTRFDSVQRGRLLFHLRNIYRLVATFPTIVTLLVAEGLLILCIYYDKYARIHPNLFLTCLVFPLAFSINIASQRRERALDDVALLKSAAFAWFCLHQEWHTKLVDPKHTELPHSHPHHSKYGKWHLQVTYDVLKDLLSLIGIYLSTPDTEYGVNSKKKRSRIKGRNVLLQEIYGRLAAISDANERLRVASQAAASIQHPLFVQPPILTRPIHWAYFITQAFEKLRGIRDYRSPTSIRSFTKALTWLVPCLLAPYFSWVAHDYQNWAAYFVCAFVTVILSALRDVQDFGENPFLPIGEDDIDNLNLKDLNLQWDSSAFQSPTPPPPEPDNETD
eukprot:TRINITY_DN18703_c0_g1_i1.p1 TRINITY_DN18703_c0_g1~~TRINITY_DN18703_c0_g1_i1.p1  ORF type:complete len:361 (+),score=53.61 TRINITY_DN18703_c0_g1_i1:81-1163(+)